MNILDIKEQLIQPNSGSEVYNKGIRKANSKANRLLKKVFNHFEERVEEIEKDNYDLKMLFADIEKKEQELRVEVARLRKQLAKEHHISCMCSFCMPVRSER